MAVMTDQTPPPAAPYTAPVAAPGAPTNVMAIIALIGAFVIPLAGIIVGFIALGQIKRTGEGGRGLALAGVILGFVFSALYIIIIGLSVLLPLLIVGVSGGYNY